MNKYYATATDSKGKSYIIFNHETFTNRLTARIEAERQCKIQGLTLDNVQVVGNGKVEGRVLSKYAAYRKRNNGNNPRSYDKAL
jgi:hypothetical protein